MSFEIVKKSVTLNGLTPIMLDRFVGQEEIPVEQKLYRAADGETLILPSTNIMGFLASKSSNSCLRQFTSNKDWKIIEPILRSSIAVYPESIPITDNGEHILFHDWTEKIRVDERQARPSSTARVIARRPKIELPWRLDFGIAINESEKINEGMVRDWFDRGGFLVGVGGGTTIGFGRFTIGGWNTA